MNSVQCILFVHFVMFQNSQSMDLIDASNNNQNKNMTGESDQVNPPLNSNEDNSEDSVAKALRNPLVRKGKINCHCHFLMFNFDVLVAND